MRKLVWVAALAGGITALSSFAASAACQMPESWSLRQSNGFTVWIKSIRQDGNGFSAYATTKGSGGDVQGRFTSGGKLLFTISWGGGSSMGEYNADIDYDDGRIFGGLTYDQRSPDKTARWSTSYRFSC